MTDEEKEVWEMGDADDLADLIDRGALQKLVNSHVLAAAKEFMPELILELSGERVHVVDIDITDDIVSKHLLGNLLDEQLDMHAAGDTHEGPGKYLENAKLTLAVLESAVEKYRKAVSGWVVIKHADELEDDSEG